MARTTAAALDRFLELLRDPAKGFQSQLQSIASRDGVLLKPIARGSLFLLNAPPELVDQSGDSAYPQVFVFAEQAENQPKERFAYFSGPLRLAADIRISAETLDRMEADLHRYVEALLNVLRESPAEWNSGLVYSGRYSVTCLPVRLGGNNFLQTAKVSFTLYQFVAA